MFKIYKPRSKASNGRTIRFPDELSEALYKVAATESVSFNEVVLQCCYYALENYDGKAILDDEEKPE